MKKFTIISIFILTLSMCVYASPLHKYTETKMISNTVSLTNVKEFYADYNLSYTYVKADISNKNTSLKLLKSPKGVDITDTVANLAASDDSTVAALNADFFSVQKGSKGFSLGIEICDGVMLQSPINPDTMATVSYENGKVNMSYLDFHIMAVAPNGAYHEVRHLNKHTTYYGDILMYTSDFNGGMSPAPGGEVVEVIIENNIVTEFRRNMPSVKIPENGCVLVVSEGINMFLANNFNVGDEIRFDYYITPGLYTAETAFGGGAMLVSDGKALKNYSHVVSGTHPRSAIGIDKDGTTVYLVAVDGRQEVSKGMTMQQLANLMVSLGCHTAINLDGGGSTSMSASTVENPQMHTVNYPSENRKVINAVGISYDSQESTPSSIIVDTDKKVAFVGEPVNVSAYVLDKGGRNTNLTATLHSHDGVVSGNVFTPTKTGNVTINASCEDARGSVQLYVMEQIAGITAQSHIYLDVGSSAKLNIGVFDTKGNHADVSIPQYVNISSSDPSVASVTDSTVTAHKDGTAIITIQKDNAITYCSVACGGGSASYTYDFETNLGLFKSYPSYVNGSFEIVDNIFHSGKSSGKLSFDFTDNNTQSKGAYFSFINKPVVSSTCDKVSMWFYSPEKFNHRMRAQFRDVNKELVIIPFDTEYKIGEWQYLTAKIPDDISAPLTLDSVYALYLDGDIQDKGYIYIDDISFDINQGQMKFKAAQSNVYDAPFEESSSKLTVASVSTPSPTLASLLAVSRTNSILNSTPYSATVGNINEYSQKETDNALIITLDVSKGGIRKTDASQWDNMSKAISATSKDNVFILSDSATFGSTDFEKDVFRDYLASLDKNVYVITNGIRNSEDVYNGVTFFTIGNNTQEKLDLTHAMNYKYLEFDFGKDTTYCWKNCY